MSRSVLPCALAVLLAGAALVAVPGTAGASDGGADQPVVRVSGTLLQTSVEQGSGRTEPAYGLRLAGGDIVPLDVDFATVPAPESRFSGTLEVPQRVQSRLAAEGTSLSDGTTVSASSSRGRRALALVDGSDSSMAVEDSTVSAPAESAASASGATHHLYVAVPDNLGHRTSSSDATILANLGKDAAYWEEQSEGRVGDLVVPTGVLHYSSHVSGAARDCGLGDSFYPMLDEAADRFPGFDEATDHIIVAIPERDCSGNVLGLGTIGSGFGSGGGLVATLAPADTLGTVAHEMGHNFGFLHSNVRCGTSCSREYAGIYDVMGYGMGAGYNQLTALSTVYRLLNGVRDAGEVADVRPGTARTLTIAPRSSTSGLRSLAVRDPKGGATYYVDLRTGQGRDARSAYAAGEPVDGYQMRTGVVVTRAYGRRDRAGRIGTGGTEVVPNGGRTAFRAGQSWTSPTGVLVVRVDAQSATSARVTVLRTVPRTAAPRISGTSKVGRRLSLSRGTWTSGTALSQTWYVGGRAVSHATSLKLTKSARGKRVVVKVTGRARGYATVTRTSAATAAVRR